MPFFVGNVMSKASICTPKSGVLDTTFAAFSDGVSANNPEEIVVQPDGKIIIAGNHNTLIVNGSTVTQNNISRLNADGTLDTTFNTGANPGTSGVIYAVAVQPDGKLIIGGGFTTVRGVTKNNIARLNTDGSLDTTFNTGTNLGVNDVVMAVALQPDGKILIGGEFLTARGVTQNGLARLNSDGTLDTTFNTGANPGTNTGSLGAADIRKFIILSDGKIIVGGDFTTIRGVTRNRVAKLNSDGSLDTTFNDASQNANVGLGSGGVEDMELLDDGKIILVGRIADYRGFTNVADIIRINSDGTRDTTWPTGGTGLGGILYKCIKQYDNKIFVSGYFTSFKGATQNSIARLNADGTLDTTFNTGSNPGIIKTDGAGSIAYVYAAALQDDCKILIGGWFSTTRGTFTGGAARLT